MDATERLPRAGAPLRVLWLIDSLALGGAERLVWPFARAVDPARVRLDVACLRSLGGNPVEGELRAAGVAVVNLAARNLRDPAAFGRLRALLVEREIELVHAHLTYATLWAAASGVPFVATLHTDPPAASWTSKAGIRERLLRRALGRAERVIAVSGSVRQGYLAAARLEPARIEVVHNGVDLADFAPRSDPAPPATPGLVLSAAVLRAGKGLEVLLEAAALLPRASFAIAGEGPERAALEARARALGVAARVRFLGHRRDLPALLAGAALFVLPSRFDALPTAILEAMAAGLPVVATRAGGIPEIVQEGITGELVEPGDAPALARAIGGLLDDPDRRREWGRAGRERAARHFSTAAWARRLETIYGRAAARGPRIALVEFAGSGGLIHYAFQLGRALQDAGARVSLVTGRHYELEGLEHPFRLERRLRLWPAKPGAPLASGWPWRLARKARRAWRGLVHQREWLRLVAHLWWTRPDLVLLGDIRFPSDLLYVRLLALGGLRVADICHNVRPFAAASGLVAAGSLSRALFEALYREMAVVFVHFAPNRREFLETYAIDPSRVTAIEHGNEELLAELADPAVTAAGLRAELGLGAGDPVVLALGTLTGYKGLDWLLEAWPRIVRRCPRARLVLAGYPAADFDLAGFERRARALGVHDSLRIVPRYLPSAAIGAWMDLAAVAVFPYRVVFHSGALHLAATFGRPIVASRVGSIPSVIEDGVNGLLVAPGDGEALGAALLRLLEDPELARRLGARAAEEARRRFGWERVARDILARLWPEGGERA